jgi:hypothetical protein
LGVGGVTQSLGEGGGTHNSRGCSKPLSLLSTKHLSSTTDAETMPLK